VALTKKPTRRFLWCAKSKQVGRNCFSSSSEPPYSGEKQKLRDGRTYKSRNVSEFPTHWQTGRDSLQHNERIIQKTKNPRRKERGDAIGWQRTNNDRSSSFVGFSQYSYRLCSGNEVLLSNLDASGSAPNKKSENQDGVRVMQSMNASALLDPLKYCKESSRLHSGSRSISGTEMARRLLSGKRDFLLAASKLNKTPVLMDGHGVPPALFQHCVDMAGALLRHYGPDIDECSFRNNRNSKTPDHVRVRRRDATNEVLPAPSAIEGESDEHRNDDEIDWDYNLTLYLTVMGRLAKNLGQVFEISSLQNNDGQKNFTEKNSRLSREDYDNLDNRHDESSPQFSSQWNVEICKGQYFDFQPVGMEGKYNPTPQTCIRPFPVVEFFSHPSSPRVLIRLQGYPAANEEFGSRQHEEQPVSLVFDACIQNPTPVVNLANS